MLALAASPPLLPVGDYVERIQAVATQPIWPVEHLGHLHSVDCPDHQHRCTVAEVTPRLSQKKCLDREARDLAGLVVFSLMAIADTVVETIDAPEKRHYCMQTER
jgi:hypothetical protein